MAATTNPSASTAWPDLARQWQDLLQHWSHAWLPVDPAAIAALNGRFLPRFQALWAAAQGAGAQAVPEVATPAPNDRRFSSKAWTDQPYFAYLMQAYLLYAEYMSALAAAAALPPGEQKRLQFITRQYLDAIAPSNFPA